MFSSITRQLGTYKVIILLLLGTVLVLMFRSLGDSSPSSSYWGDGAGGRDLKSSYLYDTGPHGGAGPGGRIASPQDLVHFDRSTPLIWVGGVPRSGTTLGRAILDAHPDIRCGEETRVIPRILSMHNQMMKSTNEAKRLREAKVTEDVLNDAMGAYILSIIAKHGEPARHLCNKDPFALRSMQKLLAIFPNSKFVLMLRDGRAVVHSIISRKVTIKGFDLTSYRGALKDWNRAVEAMYKLCMDVGPAQCLPVYYEQLVLHPESQMKRMLEFLDVPWDEVVLHHEETIGKTGGISLSNVEPSTNQVNKPINTEALSKWASHIPPDVRTDIDSIAPMLSRLGYDSHAYPPDYGTPDDQVMKQSAALSDKQKAEFNHPGAHRQMAPKPQQ